MTLNNLERQKRNFYQFFGDFGLQDTFWKQIAPKLIKIEMDKMLMKFVALNVNFDSLNFDFLGLRKLAHEGIKDRYLRKRCDEMAADRLTVCEQKLL